MAQMPLRPGRRGLLLAAGAAAVGGCGFKPVYGTRESGSSPVQDRLGEVNVLLIPERWGQILRQALQERMERSGDSAARRYDLSVQVGLSAEPIAIQPDTSVTRIRMIATANWTLLSQGPQRATLASGVAREVDGFDVINQQFFGAELARQQALRRMMEALSEQITMKLAAYFARQPA